MLFSRLRTFALFFIVSALFVCASPVDHTALDARASQATVLDVVTTHAGILKKLRNKIKQWLINQELKQLSVAQIVQQVVDTYNNSTEQLAAAAAVTDQGLSEQIANITAGAYEDTVGIFAYWPADEINPVITQTGGDHASARFCITFGDLLKFAFFLWELFEDDDLIAPLQGNGYNQTIAVVSGYPKLS